MTSARLHLLGLDSYFSRADKESQQHMAQKLRSLVFRYLKGGLTDINGSPIPDGPGVKSLRENLYLIGGMNKFVAQQSVDRAWATDIELTLLAELLDVSLMVEFAKTGNTTVLRASNNEENVVVLLRNTNNTHWDAVIDGQKDKTTDHSGNCGYDSFAKGLAAGYRQPANVDAVEHEQEQIEQNIKRRLPTQYVRTLEDYRKEEAKYNARHEDLKNNDPEKYAQVMVQIANDYQYALKIALSDLPGVKGKLSKDSVIPFSLFKPKLTTATIPQNITAPSFKAGG